MQCGDSVHPILIIVVSKIILNEQSLTNLEISYGNFNPFELLPIVEG